MIISRKTFVFLLCSVSFVLSLIASDEYVGWYRCKKELSLVSGVILEYIGSNEGKFPSNKKDLLFGWATEDEINNFDIKWGVKLEDLLEKNGILYNKNNEKLLLIEGPYKVFLPYDKISLDLFQKMKERGK